MIDSHCHLGIDDFKEDIVGILDRASHIGVSHILTVACDYSHLNDLLNMMSYKNIFGSFGIHPENAAQFKMKKTIDIFEKYPQISALGEIGLDYYHNLETKEIQKPVFESQIEIAAQFKKPLIIHSREANEDTCLILKKAFKNNLLKKRGILHCFTGSYELAQTALDLDFLISASGVITFKNADNLREIFKKIPFKNLLIETDSPYLAPEPFRGKRNESAYLNETLKVLASLKGISPIKMAEITSQNFFNLFQGKADEN